VKDPARIASDFAPREIPRPAGENAGLRNDTSVMDKISNCYPTLFTIAFTLAP
jgi:hypothetical protein